jgi:hypothetical protein
MFTLIAKAFTLILSTSQVGFPMKTPVVTYSVSSYLSRFVKAYDVRALEKSIDAVSEKLKSPNTFYEAQTEAPKNQSELEILRRVRQMSERLLGQKMLFGVRVASGDYSGLHDSSTILVIPEELARTRNYESIDLALAHEMAHFIYEFYIEKISANHTSPHGLPSRKDDGSISSDMKSTLAHSEIDAIAAVILHKMGKDPVTFSNELAHDLTSQLSMLTTSVGFSINDSTSWKQIPAEDQPKVQDLYIRANAIQYTLSQLVTGS